MSASYHTITVITSRKHTIRSRDQLLMLVMARRTNYIQSVDKVSRLMLIIDVYTHPRKHALLHQVDRRHDPSNPTNDPIRQDRVRSGWCMLLSRRQSTIIIDWTRRQDIYRAHTASDGRNHGEELRVWPTTDTDQGISSTNVSVGIGGTKSKAAFTLRAALRS